MSKIVKPIYLVLCLLAFINTFGQNESYPCNCCNTNLKKLFHGEVLDNLNVHACWGSGLHDLSSSYLKPEGTAPKIIEDPDGGVPDDGAYVTWTCKYSMGNVQDKNPKTAWVEGVDGPGIGEVIVVPCLDLSKPVKIWIGYGKSDAIYKANNRPSKVRAVIIKAEKFGAPQEGYTYENLSIISEMIVALEDKNDFQPLPIPSFKPESYFSSRFGEETDYMYFLGLEILDVYKGSKYDDTCISEIANQE